MLDGAVGEYCRRGGAESDLGIIEAPGTYELVSIANAAAKSGLYRSIVCLGCVIRGQTTHDEHIARAVAHGLVEISNATDIPVAFGVVTAMNIEQARDRAGGDKGNKGADAMAAALDAVAAINAIEDGKDSKTPGVRFTPGLTPHDKAATQ